MSRLRALAIPEETITLSKRPEMMLDPDTDFKACQNPSRLVFTSMFTPAAIIHSTYRYVFQAKYEELRNEGGSSTVYVFFQLSARHTS